MKRLGFALAISLLACNPDEPARKVFAAPESFRIGLGEVYAGYLIVQDGLARDNLTIAKNSFSAMHGKLHALSTDGLDSAARSYWDSGNVHIMQVLHHSTALTGELPEIRTLFMDFTPMLLDMMERFGAKAQTPVNLFHCPMAREGKGADWLQKDASPANPYYGQSMPTCGALVREVVPGS